MRERPERDVDAKGHQRENKQQARACKRISNECEDSNEREATNEHEALTALTKSATNSKKQAWIACVLRLSTARAREQDRKRQNSRQKDDECHDVKPASETTHCASLKHDK